MERVLLLSPLLILLTGLNFYATAHLNCGPVITPRYYIPAIYVLLITFLTFIQNQTKNQNRPELLLKSARCEIPDFTIFFYNSLSHQTTPLTVSHLLPKRMSQIYKASMTENVSMSLNLRLNESKDKRRLRTAHI